jgi:hypothetical protein
MLKAQRPELMARTLVALAAEGQPTLVLTPNFLATLISQTIKHRENL